MNEEQLNKKEKNILLREGIIKFDPLSAKLLPISANRKRKKGWEVYRVYQDKIVKIKAFESLNGYDFVTLFQLIDDYIQNNEEWQVENEKSKFIKRRLNLKDLCKQRGILTKKANRKTIADSIDRWYKAEILYTSKKKMKVPKEERKKYPIFKTRYIFEFGCDENFEEAEITANKDFIEFCIRAGMAMNWRRLVNYGKNYYAIQLDIYLQFSSILYNKKHKKYKYPDIVREETLFLSLGVNEDVKELRHKREKVKQAFKAFEKETGVKYIYDKKERKWIKESYLKYLQEKNKK